EDGLAGSMLAKLGDMFAEQFEFLFADLILEFPFEPANLTGDCFGDAELQRRDGSEQPVLVDFDVHVGSRSNPQWRRNPPRAASCWTNSTNCSQRFRSVVGSVWPPPSWPRS